MRRLSTSQFLIISALAKNFWPIVTSPLRCKKKDLKSLPSTIRFLFYFEFLVVASFAWTVDGSVLDRKQKMDNRLDPEILNREQFKSEMLPCQICQNARLLMPFFVAQRHYYASDISEIRQSRFSVFVKTIRRICGGPTYLKCRLLHQQMIRSEKVKLTETKLNNNQEDSSDNAPSIGPVERDRSAPHLETLSLNTKALSRRKRLASGDRRLVHMFCRTNFILEIKPNGAVVGSRRKTSNTELEKQTVLPGGVVRFYSPATGYYLAMNKHGRLYGTKSYSLSNSAFKERLLENMWSTYSAYELSQKLSSGRTRRSVKRAWYVAIGKSGKPRKASRIRASSRAAQFLPLS